MFIYKVPKRHDKIHRTIYVDVLYDIQGVSEMSFTRWLIIFCMAKKRGNFFPFFFTSYILDSTYLLVK